MAIPVVASPTQLSPGALHSLGIERAIPIRPEGGQTIRSFQEALTERIQGQAAALLHPEQVQGGADTNFRGFATQIVEDVQRAQSNAATATRRVLQGDGAALHTAMIAMEEASVSFQLLVEMRNKIVESVQELMRMQV